MKKSVYKVVDDKGRVHLPKQLRQMAELECGDIVALHFQSGTIAVAKVDLIEVGNQDPEAVDAYVSAAIRRMSRSKQVEMAARILHLLSQEEGV